MSGMSDRALFNLTTCQSSILAALAYYVLELHRGGPDAELAQQRINELAGRRCKMQVLLRALEELDSRMLGSYAPSREVLRHREQLRQRG